MNCNKPQKQGGLYSLNLGQNNGPYLQKDIMITNPKSMFLVGSDSEGLKTAFKILSNDNKVNQDLVPGVLYEPPNFYDANLRTFANYDERYQCKLSSANNFKCASQFAQDGLIKLQQQSQKYKQLIQEYKQDIEYLQQQIHNQNINNIKEVHPQIYQLYKTYEQLSQQENSKTFKMLRQIEQLNRDKIQLQKDFNFCVQRVDDLQKQLGISIQQNEDERQEDLSENEINNN